MGVDLGGDLRTAVAAYRAQVYRYQLGMTRDPHLAEDLTQETMLRAIRGVGSLHEPAALLSWLYRLATNVFLDRVRSDRRRATIGKPLGPCMNPADDVPEPGPDIEQVVEMREMSACVREYVNHLPHSYRAAILLHDGYGLTDREVAEALGITLVTAKARIRRARARLRSALGAGCQFEIDDRGVLVCQRAPGQADCPPDCACHTRQATAG